MSEVRSRHYIEASRRLLEYASINRSDTEFADSGEIVYIFDTSVLEAYWRRDPTDVGGRYGVEALLTYDAARYSGWLALKFLMEQQLPGLRRATAYVSPAHWNEALDRVGRLETQVRRDMKGDPTTQDTIDESLRELLSLKDYPDKLIQEAKRRKLDDVFTAIMTAVSSAERIKGIFISGRASAPSVRVLTFSAHYLGVGDQPMRHADFTRWLGRISHHRAMIEADRQRSTADGERNPRRPSATQSATRNNENDALTLATIQAMYRANMQAEVLGEMKAGRATDSSPDPRPRVRFVFVTPDAALHAAFQDLAPRLTAEGIPLFIRHPHVYTPLLNHANMSRDLQIADRKGPLSSVFKGVEDALDALFPFANNATTAARASQLDLSRNIKGWSDSVEILCLSNSHYVLSDLGGEYVGAEVIAELLSSADVREAAARFVHRDIEQIRDHHMQQMSAVALESVSAVLARAQATGGRGQRHRAPVKLVEVNIPEALRLHVDRHNLGQIAWLEDLLLSFRTQDRPEAMRDIIGRMTAAWNEPHQHAAAHLLAACIYFSVDAWDPARACAELCRERIERGPARERRGKWLREARYCEALALRMQMRSQSDVSHARKLLTDNLADHSVRLAYLRDKVERATLLLTATIVQTIEDDFQQVTSDPPFIDLMERDKLSTAFEDSVADLVDVLKEIENFEVPNSDGTATRIRLQAEINHLGALIFHVLLGPRLTTDSVDRGGISRALVALQQTLAISTIKPSKTAEVYMAVGVSLVTSEPADAGNALALLSSPAMGEADLSRADRVEIDFLSRRLAPSVASLPLAASATVIGQSESRASDRT